MKIGGFQKHSLIDWDGKLSAVIFTKGCNMRCFYCHNKSLAFPELLGDSDELDENEILKYLSGRRGFLDAVIVGGGEPTVQDDLLLFLAKIKAMGFLIKLDTNGTNPDVIRQALCENLLDYIAMDIKTVLEYDNYLDISNGLSIKLFENIKRSVEILKKSGIEYVFRTTLIESIHTSEILSVLRKEFPMIKFQKYRDSENRTF